MTLSHMTKLEEATKSPIISYELEERKGGAEQSRVCVAMAEIAHKPHVLLFPFPTLGHINPMTLLAAHLASSGGLDITLIHTARTLSLLQHKKLDNLSSGIRVEVIEDLLTAIDGKGVPLSPSVVHFMDSIPLLKERLEELLQRLMAGKDGGRLPPCCIISDTFLPWTQDVATKFNLPRIEFWSSSVTCYAMGCYIPQLISKGYLPVKPGTAFITPASSKFYSFLEVGHYL
jgi:hypothetical protein